MGVPMVQEAKGLSKFWRTLPLVLVWKSIRKNHEFSFSTPHWMYNATSLVLLVFKSRNYQPSTLAPLGWKFPEMHPVGKSHHKNQQYDHMLDFSLAQYGKSTSPSLA